MKGQCRQRFEPLENLTKVFKFVFIPSVFIHKKKYIGIGRTALKGSIEAKFFKFRYVLKLKTPLILVCCDPVENELITILILCLECRPANKRLSLKIAKW